MPSGACGRLRGMLEGDAGRRDEDHDDLNSLAPSLLHHPWLGLPLVKPLRHCRLVGSRVGSTCACVGSCWVYGMSTLGAGSNR